MKIAITSSKPSIDSQIESRFGRCSYFVIVDLDTMEFEAVENANGDLSTGAGIQSATLIANKGVQAVLTGNIGPKAFATLEAAGIQVVVGATGIASQAAERFKQGEFTSATAPNVTSHFGTTGAS